MTLARAVAHDVNNAVGGILPLAQQMREDLRRGRGRSRRHCCRGPRVIDRQGPRSASASSPTCCASARRAHRATGRSTSTRSCAETLPFFQGQAAAAGVEVALELAEELPAVRFSRNDLQHVVLEPGDQLARGHGRTAGGSRSTAAPAEAGGGRAGRGRRRPGHRPRPAGQGAGAVLHHQARRHRPGARRSAASLAWQNGGASRSRSAPGEGTRADRGLRLAGADGDERGEA